MLRRAVDIKHPPIARVGGKQKKEVSERKRQRARAARTCEQQVGSKEPPARDTRSQVIAQGVTRALQLCARNLMSHASLTSHLCIPVPSRLTLRGRARNPGGADSLVQLESWGVL